MQSPELYSQFSENVTRGFVSNYNFSEIVEIKFIHRSKVKRKFRFMP